jgi:hypothetical protein
VNTPGPWDAAPAQPRVAGWALAARIALVSLPPLLLAMWPLVPALRPAVLEIEGPAAPQRDCVGPFCGERLAVAGRSMACRIDFIGLPDDCRLQAPAGRALPAQALQAGLPVQARFAEVPTLRSLLGLAPRDAVLLRLQQGERVLLRRSLHAQAWAALYGGWLFHAVYWPLVALLMWRRPQSRLSQRLWARITWTEPPR